MAYDPHTANMVLFGGDSTSTGYSSQTWTWNGANWANPYTGFRVVIEPR